jgi:hypothetical protein
MANSPRVLLKVLPNIKSFDDEFAAEDTVPEMSSPPLNSASKV